MRKEMQALAFGILMAALPCAAATAPQEAPEGNPEAVLDLATADGVRLVAGQWRYSDARIVETEFPAAGPEGQPTGPPGKTWDISPHAGSADFDDSKWEALAPEALSVRRGGGRLSFNWYRITITVPPKVGSYDTSGKTAVFETTVDDA